MEDSERSSNSANRDRCFPRTKLEQHGNIIDDSKLVIGDKMHSLRYFVIKSFNYENIQLSVEKEIWATQPMNEPILEEAFDSSSKVILVFSVNKSGFFNGYAQMMSSVGQRRDSVWSQGTGANNSWGRSFKVKWLRVCNLPFYKTLHLKNPLNEYKPVKISGDCQELPSEVGEALCTLIDREFEDDPDMMRRHDLEPGCSFPEETGNLSPNDMIWGATYMFHPSLLHQYHLEANGWHSAHNGSGGVYPSDYLTMANKGALVKRANSKGLVLDLPVDSSGMPGEMSPFGSTLNRRGVP